VILGDKVATRKLVLDTAFTKTHVMIGHKRHCREFVLDLFVRKSGYLATEKAKAVSIMSANKLGVLSVRFPVLAVKQSIIL
jgi:hypothetical protein